MQLCGGGWIKIGQTADGCPLDPPMILTRQSVDRNIAQLGIAICAQRPRQLGAVGQQLDRILRAIGRTERKKFALERIIALRSDGDLRHRAGQVALCSCDP